MKNLSPRLVATISMLCNDIMINCVLPTYVDTWYNKNTKVLRVNSVILLWPYFLFYSYQQWNLQHNLCNVFFFWTNALHMHTFVLSKPRSVRSDNNFYSHHVSNLPSYLHTKFKTIRPNLCPWQCYRFWIKVAAVTSYYMWMSQTQTHN